MPKQVVFVLDPTMQRGRVRSVPREMVRDLLTVSQVPRELITELAKKLENESGFVTPDRLAEVVGEVLTDSSHVNATLAALNNLRPDQVDQTIRNLNDWREADQANAKQFPAEAFASLKEQLPLLIRDYPGLERYRKAEWLASVTGNTLETLELICDLRPVFDKGREVVEGLIPLTTLKLVYSGQDGVSQSVDVLLAADELDDLLNKANKAKQKLAALRECVNEWVPDGWVEPE